MAFEDFPSGTVIKNLSCSAGDTGSIPGQGKSHILQGQLSPCAKTTEPVPWRLGAATTEPKHSRACAQQKENP